MCLLDKRGNDYIFELNCLSVGAEDYNMRHEVPEGNISSQLFTGVMAFVMGIVTMIRVTKNMPKKLTDATIYSNPGYNVDEVDRHKSTPGIYGAEYIAVMKRMAELEDAVTILSAKPAAMLAEKEEMLNAAVSRVDALEQELMSTRRVI